MAMLSRSPLKKVTFALALCLAAGCDDGATGAPLDGVADAATSLPDASVPETEAPDAAGIDHFAPPAQGFQLKTPPIVVPSATEETYCYYFTVPLDEAAGVKRWQSRMSAGSHHLILYFTAEPGAPDGTVTTGCDGFGGGLSNVPVWTYSAQSREADMQMPAGVGMTVGAQQHGYIQMHYLNPTLEPLEVQVAVNGETFAAGESYVRAAAYVTYNTRIAIPAGVGATASADGSCRVKPGVSFFALSTHAHRRAVSTQVADGGETIFSSDDWEHPGAQRWDAGYTFRGNLEYRCDYENDLPVAVKTGASAETDEMCMAVGYFYPAERPAFCINSLVVAQ